jgi:hypothetical protein
MAGKAERAGLAGFTPTSAQAVAAAEIARNQECGRVGPNCRARVAELSTALRDRALTERAAVPGPTRRSSAPLPNRALKRC